ncbi:MAG: EAL domain-containing protein [Pseudomonadota bacterium]
MQRRETLIREMTRDIGPALESGAFVPFFQIQVDTHTKTVFGVEVLGRWLHPRHGVIAPKQFLYVAERARLTEQIDRSIYLKALDHFAAWRAQGIGLQHISFNVTGRALADGTFLTWFENALRERGLHPSDVVLELVETILLDGESRDITETAAALAEAGFRLAIDDFGTGHASIASLISVPVRLVKIDRTFVAGIHESVERTLLTKAIIDLSKQLNIEVLAEGVEARAERDLITSLGCPLFQGYFYGRPVPAAQVEEAIQDACWMLSTPDEQDDAKVAGPLRNAI